MTREAPEIYRSIIRNKAFGVLWRGDQILVGLGEDRKTGQKFGRLVGGGVELGEYSRDALIREMREEFDIGVTITRQLGWLENIFTYEGVPGHEVIALYEMTTDDTAIFEQDTMPILDGNGIMAAWLSLTEMDAQRMKLYPTGLREMIEPQEDDK